MTQTYNGATNGATATSIYVPDRSGPLLPLDEFRRIIGFHPYHFWQLAGSEIVPISDRCNALVMQHAWQNADAVGRHEITEAIIAAERKLHQVLGISPAPRAEYDEVPFPAFYDRRQGYLSSADAQGRWLNVNTKSKRVQQVGKLGLTFIGNASVVLSDDNADGLVDAFTLSIATSVTDPEQIAVYFAAPERFDGSSVSERWRVQPVTVMISGGTATIKGRVWTIVKPVLYEGYAQQAIDPADTDNFVTTLAVYRRAVDTSDQGELVWETSPDGAPCDVSGDPSNTADPSAITTLSARYVVRNSDNGQLAGEAAYYDTDTEQWIANGWPVGYAPERARVHYMAGYPLEGGQMAEWMKIIVARLAAAEMERPACGCDTANKALARWQVDLAQTTSSESADNFQIAFEDLTNPFGTRRGHVFAWRQVKELMEIRGITA